MIRLNKVISLYTLYSRREADAIINEGRVAVNGVVVKSPGIQVDPLKDHIRVDNKIINSKGERREAFIAFNKPGGVITTSNDPKNRPTVYQFLKGVRGRFFPVGRLDYDAEGLILFTNNGEVAYRLTKPKYGVSRVYLVKAEGMLTQRDLQRLYRGIYINGQRIVPTRIEPYRSAKVNSWWKVILKEGKNHQIKIMFKAIGHSVMRLKRIKYATVSLSTLSKGRYRFLSPSEIKSLKKVVGM